MADGGSSLEDIGRRVLALRNALGHNQTAFAKLTGLSQSALANYEAGHRRPDLDAAFKLVNRTGITLDWLYLGVRSGLPQRLLEQVAELDQQDRKAG